MVHKLLSTLTSKEVQLLKLGQLIKYYIIKNIDGKWEPETSPRPLFNFGKYPKIQSMLSRNSFELCTFHKN